MLRAVIFDFDGVITDSEILHLRAFNKVLAQFNIKVSTKDYYREYLGLTDADCFKLVAKRYRLPVHCKEIGNLMKQKARLFEQLTKAEGRIIEGVSEFLRMLQRNNITMAICSGALLPEIEIILEEARLRELFAVIVSAEQVKKGKPDPQGFLLTLQKLNLSRQKPIAAKECIVVEDSHWGLEAARAAGMHTVAVTNSYDADQLSAAEKIVARLDELSIEGLQQLCVR